MIEITRKQIEERYGYSPDFWLLQTVKDRGMPKYVLQDEQLYLIQDLILVEFFTAKDVADLFDLRPDTMNALLRRHNFNPTSQFVKKFVFIRHAISTYNGLQYDYRHLVYEKSTKPLEVHCKRHGAFQVIAKKHIEGEGCPVCKKALSSWDSTAQEMDKKVKRSKQHQMVIDFLEKYGYEIISEWTGFNGNRCINPETNHLLRFDVYVPELSLCVEIQGPHHFDSNHYYHRSNAKRDGITPTDSFERLLERDALKEQYCELNGLEHMELSHTILDSEYPIESVFAPYLK